MFRVVYLWQLCLLASLLAVWKYVELSDFKVLLENIICNLLFLFFVFGLLLLYTRFRGISHKQSFGKGDVYFFIVTTITYSIENYCIFFVVGLVFSLIFSLLLKVIGRAKNTTIPLAGNFALFLLMVLMFEYVTKVPFPFLVIN